MDELEQFKSIINLSEYAASQGYLQDKHESSQNSLVMRHPISDDKVIIARGQDGHWTYFSVRDEKDSGSIIDFIQRRQQLTLGQVRQQLRPWLGKQSLRASRGEFTPPVKSVSKDRTAVIQAYSETMPVFDARYLHMRGIRQEVLNNPRFEPMIRQDSHKNIIFPHYDREGLCGFEIKNYKFTGFAPGGLKSVWRSQARRSDNRLVLVESAIDALSYHQLRGDSNTRYMSIAGQMNGFQREELLPAAMSKMQAGSTVVAAFDNDEDGEKFACHVQASSPPGLRVVREKAEIGKDWNDQLKHAEQAFITSYQKQHQNQRSAVIAFAHRLEEDIREPFLKEVNGRLSDWKEKASLER